MGFQSKTYSLSDEVVAVIDAAREKGESPNKFLRRLLGLDTLTHSSTYSGNRLRDAKVQLSSPSEPVNLDATGPELSSGRGKVTTETRGPRRREDEKE